ncbi:helix-turn-helix domain-containing protein [Enterococcus sp. LJL90]
MLFERVKELANSQDKNLKQVAEEIGLSENAFYKWKKQSPKAETLQKVADYFDVTTDYLLGRNQAPKWADKDDLIELDKLLDSNVNMAYNGENLTQEEIQRVKDILTGVFWEYAEKDKKLKK